MTTFAGEFPDVVTCLLDELEQFGSTGEVSPDDVDEHLPFIRVRRTGGTTLTHLDINQITVDVIHNTRNAARGLSQQISSFLLDSVYSRGGLIGDKRLDRVDVAVPPFTLPITDESVRTWSASYTMTARRQ